MKREMKARPAPSYQAISGQSNEQTHEMVDKEGERSGGNQGEKTAQAAYLGQGERVA